MISKRLTRQESREITRQELLQAAADLFAECGVNGTSVEQIVERAGYTRGAFYGNFDGKQQLILALLEQRTERELAEVQALSANAGSFEETIEHLRTWHRERDKNFASWLALRTELWLYGMRDPAVLSVLADRERRSREAMAQALTQGFAARSVTPPAPVELLALIVHALDDGLSIQRVLSAGESPAGGVMDVVDLLMRSWTALARAGTTEPTGPPAPESGTTP
ncbi:TetR/AcrR family transcriptional regulator [Streptomyces diastaticus]|uniref:TetR/AcrR family transcriptional regulator n=1 Tax=Streptomyces TaxID=1883 RepID=UPI000D116BE7|nr:TetR/AcrR family transcriptional regulator [Streptomyces anulatus]